MHVEIPPKYLEKVAKTLPANHYITPDIPSSGNIKVIRMSMDANWYARLGECLSKFSGKMELIALGSESPILTVERSPERTYIYATGGAWIEIRDNLIRWKTIHVTDTRTGMFPSQTAFTIDELLPKPLELHLNHIAILDGEYYELPIRSCALVTDEGIRLSRRSIVELIEQYKTLPSCVCNRELEYVS